MADKTLGLGKLIAKSKSIRRSRRGSVDFNDGNSSIGSDDMHHVSRDHSSLSRFAHHFTAHSQAHTTDSDDSRSIVTHVPAADEKEAEESTSSLVSYDSDDYEG